MTEKAAQAARRRWAVSLALSVALASRFSISRIIVSCTILSLVTPHPTLYPPNLAHDLHDLHDLRTCVAVSRESCIVSVKRGEKTVHYTPDCSTDVQWWEQVMSYYVRQKKNKLPVAECHLEAIRLDPAYAPVFTSCDWDWKPMNLSGIELDVTNGRLSQVIPFWEMSFTCFLLDIPHVASYRSRARKPRFLKRG